MWLFCGYFASLAIPLGVSIPEFAKGEAPILQNPICTLNDVKKLRLVTPELDLEYVMEAIRIVRGQLSGVPLSVFAALRSWLRPISSRADRRVISSKPKR